MVLGYGSAASDVYVVAPRNQKPGERYVRLPGGSSLNFAVNYRALHASDRRTWTATIASYRYGLYDRDGHEVLSYHWHPDTYSHMTTPHLHLGGGVAAWRPDFAKAHIPTGLVTLEDVLLLAIEELILDVEPLRADWRDILIRNDALTIHAQFLLRVSPTFSRVSLIQAPSRRSFLWGRLIRLSTRDRHAIIGLPRR